MRHDARSCEIYQITAQCGVRHVGEPFAIFAARLLRAFAGFDFGFGL